MTKDQLIKKAIAQTFSAGLPDFAGDTHGVTIIPGGPGKLIDCMKCSDCGFSVTSAAFSQNHQRPWVKLTNEEATSLWEATHNDDSWELIKRVEAKLKEKNT